MKLVSKVYQWSLLELSVKQAVLVVLYNEDGMCNKTNLASKDRGSWMILWVL